MIRKPWIRVIVVKGRDLLGTELAHECPLAHDAGARVFLSGTYAPLDVLDIAMAPLI